MLSEPFLFCVICLICNFREFSALKFKSKNIEKNTKKIILNSEIKNARYNFVSATKKNEYSKKKSNNILKQISLHKCETIFQISLEKSMKSLFSLNVIVHSAQHLYIQDALAVA